jgi:hypothetical protein
MLIIQPILIRNKKVALHRLIGKLSYFLFPLIFISVVLLAHNRHSVNEENLDLNLFVPFKDLLILGTAYFIAIRYRHKIDLHARGMIATGIVFIEPALVRLTYHLSNNYQFALLCTIFILYSLFIFLIIKERHQKKGRWVFPLILGIYMIVHTIIVFNIHIAQWAAFAKWFAALPLT